MYNVGYPFISKVLLDKSLTVASCVWEKVKNHIKQATNYVNKLLTVITDDVQLSMYVKLTNSKNAIIGWTQINKQYYWSLLIFLEFIY